MASSKGLCESCQLSKRKIARICAHASVFHGQKNYFSKHFLSDIAQSHAKGCRSSGKNYKSMEYGKRDTFIRLLLATGIRGTGFTHAFKVRARSM